MTTPSSHQDLAVNRIIELGEIVASDAEAIFRHGTSSHIRLQYKALRNIDRFEPLHFREQIRGVRVAKLSSVGGLKLDLASVKPRWLPLTELDQAGSRHLQPRRKPLHIIRL